MRAFSSLLESLGLAQSRNRKLSLLAAYFKAAPDPDRGWALAALTDGVPLRLSLRRMLAELTATVTDPVLYKLSRDYVGDTAETVALLWPDAVAVGPPPTLDDVVRGFQAGTGAEQLSLLRRFLDSLDARGRWALLKLLGGAPRVGVSARLARIALAEAFEQDVGEIEEVWHAVEPPYRDLFAWLEGRADQPRIAGRAVYRPMMLAHPLDDDALRAMQPAEVAAEWKWDGIRVQIVAEQDAQRIFSRQGDDISAAFPEILADFADKRVVVDGELLVVRDGIVAPFNDLQQRLNRRTVDKNLLVKYPAHVRLYDMLFDAGDDVRSRPFDARRARLEQFVRENPLQRADLSALVAFEDFNELRALWAGARDAGVEGLMLKRRDSAYLAGRVKGAWFKWKRATLTLDCVLMYAQRGSGKRSSFYSDYTFGLWRRTDAGEELVPVGKSYSGFTDEDLRRLDRWTREHTVQSYGPVRAVAPGLVLEIEFDAIQPSTRHKSGIAMRFPRVHRIRWDKPAREADRLETARALIAS